MRDVWLYCIGLFILGLSIGNSLPDLNKFYILGGSSVTLQTRCFHGYIFVVNDNNPRQMIDEQGRGVKCEGS